jgi:hypothetical protein
MDTVISSDQINNKAKCYVEVSTVMYGSEFFFPEEFCCILVKFQLENSEEEIQLKLDSARCLISLIEASLNHIKNVLPQNHQILRESKFDITYKKIRNEGLNKITSFSEFNTNQNSNLEVNIYLSLDNEFYISMGFFDEDEKYFLSGKSAIKLKEGLIKSIIFIEEHPPRLISSFQVGCVTVINLDKKNGQIEIEIEGGLFDRNEPCISVNINEDLEQDNYFNAWRLSDGEAYKLSDFLLEAVSVLKSDQSKDLGDIGHFYENDSENKNPWLLVKTELSESEKLIKLIFDDELIQESESIGTYLLTEVAAEALSELLRRALQVKVEHPPYVYKAPEPDNIIIAEIE